MASRFQSFALHPFLWSLYPILAYSANNVGQIRISEALRTGLISLLITTTAYLLMWAVWGKPKKIALLLTLGLFFFFSYGHIYDSLKLTFFVDLGVVRHRYLLPLMLALLTFLAWLSIRRDFGQWIHQTLTLMVLVALVFPVLQIGSYWINSQRISNNQEDLVACKDPEGQPQASRDIYLFILDAYARADIFEELHNYDNQRFLHELEDKGFYAADGSLSNYRHTEMSLASLLNMNYLQDIPGSYSPASQNRMGLVNLIQNSKVQQEFECLGYQIVAFETGVFWTEWQDADYFFNRDTDLFERLILSTNISRFEAGLLETTAARIVQDLIIQTSDGQDEIVRSSDQEHRNIVLNVFENMDHVVQIDQPKFVFAHVLSPHPPFVFGRNGEPVGQGRFEDTAEGTSEEELLDAYVDQVIFLNSKMQETIDIILANSDEPPIIVIMGDHGWAERDAEDKLSILNAYHFPGEGSQLLYPTITPVNTFRAIFDYYFGLEYEMLPDVSYFSTEQDVYDFEVVENSWEQQ